MSAFPRLACSMSKETMRWIPNNEQADFVVGWIAAPGFSENQKLQPCSSLYYVAESTHDPWPILSYAT